MKPATHSLTKIALLTALLIVALGASHLFAAWSTPSSDPTGSNTLPPLNEGGQDQSKSAGLSLLKLIVNGPVQIQDGTEGAGKVLRSDANGLASWASSSGGVVSQLDQGDGIVLTPNPITGTGTVGADASSLQSRVSGECASDQAIRKVNADGSVECVSMPAGVTCTYNNVEYSWGDTCSVGLTQYTCSGFPSYSKARVLNCQSDGSWVSFSSCSYYPSC